MLDSVAQLIANGNAIGSGRSQTELIGTTFESISLKRDEQWSDLFSEKH